MRYCIYEIVNLTNGKRYIGCTKKFDVRCKQHLAELKKGVHVNSHLQNSFDKHGENYFEFNIIKVFDNEVEMYINERDMISLNDDLYNIAEGGLGGDTFTNRSEEDQEITRKKLSKRAKISNQKNRSLHSENTKELWKNDEYRNKVLTKVREISNNSDYRKKLSDGVRNALKDPEKRKIWSECKKGKANGRWSGYLEILKDNVVIEKYESIISASKSTGLSRDTIAKKTKNGEAYKNKKSEYDLCYFRLVKE